MNRKEFIDELKRKLNKLPYDEITNAISYYEEYFDEAGSENEQKAIEELGNISDIAAQILADFAIKQTEDSGYSPKKGLSAIWIIILAIFASPIAIPLAIVAVVLILTFIFVLFIILFSFGVVGISFFTVGIICTFISIILMFHHFVTAICTVGLGLFFIGLGAIIIYVTAISSKVSFKWIINTIGNSISRRKENGK